MRSPEQLARVRRRWTPTRDPAFAPTREIPITMEDCALFAAERTDVLRAESAARELADRLRPWHAPAFTHVRWWVIPATFRGFGSTDTRPGVNYALMFASTTLFQALPDRTFGALLGNGRAWASAWADAAAADLSGASRFSSEPIRFAALPNPFEPLAELEATGYSTMEWMTTDGGVLLVMLSES